MPQDVQELNLSDVQKTKIRVIVQRFRPQVTSAREKQRSQYEQRVEKILRKPTFDEEEARSTIAKYRQENAGKKQEYAEHELQLMRQKHAIFQVLTPEQQEQYLHLRSAHAAYDEYYASFKSSLHPMIGSAGCFFCLILPRAVPKYPAGQCRIAATTAPFQISAGPSHP